MGRGRYRKKYSTSRRYRRTGQMGTGTAFLILVGLVVLYNYWQYILVFALGLAAIVFTYKYFEKRRLLRSGIKDIDKMDGRDFEEYLGSLFKAHGYKTGVTKASGDYGADLVLTKGSWRIIVQAKRYSAKVGISAVQEIVSAMPIYKANEAWVVTNNSYTLQAQRLAAANGVKLIERSDLIKLINKVNHGPKNAPSALVENE